jgi:hypothetical protein
MPPAPDLDYPGFPLPWSTRLRGLAYRVGQGKQVVSGRSTRVWIRCKPHDLPAPRRAQALSVLVAQVVAVGFGERGQRA